MQKQVKHGLQVTLRRELQSSGTSQGEPAGGGGGGDGGDSPLPIWWWRSSPSTAQQASTAAAVHWCWQPNEVSLMSHCTSIKKFKS